MSVAVQPLRDVEYQSRRKLRRSADDQTVADASTNRKDPREKAIEAFLGALDQTENTLVDWFRDPSALADDETDAPNPDAIRQALAMSKWLRASVSTSPLDAPVLPLRGITIGTGGAISMEFALGPRAVTFVFRADGSAEQLVFESNRLRSRNPIIVG